MNELQLPRLISDGMVLQKNRKCRIWGWDIPGRKVLVSFLGKEYIVITDEQGKWEVQLKENLPGGPYAMWISDDAGNEKIIEDILVGDVWFCSGQSNMELPMERVKDKYPGEIAECTNSAIRTFKITEHADFHGPLRDVLTGEWRAAAADTILQFSATAYFFAKALYQMTGVPVGLINASLGGSRIESWMGRDMLEGYEEFLALADRYGDARFIEGRLRQNVRQSETWHRNLDEKDQGLLEEWQKENADTALWREVKLPFFFRDTALSGFIGSVWFRRKFTVSGELAGKSAKLWLGTIVDSDTVYINNVQVGHTDYQYPPRKYVVPEGLLREGENTIVIRVKCEKGKGRFTPGKKYALWTDEEEVSLEGTWLYRKGASCREVPETDFVNWKPTGLYHGMTAPCHDYTIAGILWYQGESNTHVPDVYLDLQERMIKGYRAAWKDEKLPFYYVQLPNYAIDIHDSDTDETGYGWPAVRELQRQALKVPYTGMVVSMDLGEDNDLHPLNKKDIGLRLALLAGANLYGMDTEYTGPVPESVAADADTEMGCRVTVACSHVKGGMYAYSECKGKKITDFEIAGSDGVFYPAQACLEKDKVVVTCKQVTEPVKIRYCYRNTASGGLIYNRAGLPMSPFVMEI